MAYILTGELVGDELGVDDGVSVGLADGNDEGLSVGESDGEDDGIAVGLSEGDADGAGAGGQLCTMQKLTYSQLQRFSSTSKMDPSLHVMNCDTLLSMQ